MNNELLLAIFTLLPFAFADLNVLLVSGSLMSQVKLCRYVMNQKPLFEINK